MMGIWNAHAGLRRAQPWSPNQTPRLEKMRHSASAAVVVWTYRMTDWGCSLSLCSFASGPPLRVRLQAPPDLASAFRSSILPPTSVSMQDSWILDGSSFLLAQGRTEVEESMLLFFFLSARTRAATGRRGDGEGVGLSVCSIRSVWMSVCLDVV